MKKILCHGRISLLDEEAKRAESNTSWCRNQGAFRVLCQLHRNVAVESVDLEASSVSQMRSISWQATTYSSSGRCRAKPPRTQSACVQPKIGFFNTPAGLLTLEEASCVQPPRCTELSLALGVSTAFNKRAWSFSSFIREFRKTVVWCSVQKRGILTTDDTKCELSKIRIDWSMLHLVKQNCSAIIAFRL